MLEEIALFCRLVVAGVLLASGAAKLADRAGTRDAVRAFGVPAAWVRPIAGGVPPAELTAAALLVPAATTQLGAAVALLLLSSFTTAILWNLARGRRPECHCFGRLGSSDVSGRTVARNLLLTCLAGTGLLTPAAGVTDHTTQALAVLLLAAVATVVALMTAEVWAARRASEARQRDTDLQFDADLTEDHVERGQAARFTLPSLDGSPVSIADLLDGERPLLLAFLSPGCGPCRRLRPVVSRWAGAFNDRLSIAVITSGSLEANEQSFADTAVPVLLDEDRSVALQYGVPSRPSAVLVNSQGALLGPIAAGDRNVRELVGAVLSGSLDRRRTAADVPAESLSLSSAPGPRVTVTTTQDSDAPDVVLMDEVSGASASLDPLGSLVWQCLDGRTPLRQIVEDLAEAFGAPIEVVGADVLRLVHHVGRLGLLDGVAAAVEDDPTADARGSAHAVAV